MIELSNTNTNLLVPLYEHASSFELLRLNTRYEGHKLNARLLQITTDNGNILPLSFAESLLSINLRTPTEILDFLSRENATTIYFVTKAHQIHNGVLNNQNKWKLKLAHDFQDGELVYILDKQHIISLDREMHKKFHDASNLLKMMEEPYIATGLYYDKELGTLRPAECAYIRRYRRRELHFIRRDENYGDVSITQQLIKYID